MVSKSHDIEAKVRRRAHDLGFDIGRQHVGNGVSEVTLLDPETGEVFATARDHWSLLGVLWRIPSIVGRRPRPSVEELCREVARKKGYNVLARPNGGIAFVDPRNAGRAVTVQPFWRHALAALLKLPSIARPKPPPPRTPEPSPPTYRESPRLSRDDERELAEERERRTDAGEELEAEPVTCPTCGGRGCDACGVDGFAPDLAPPPITGAAPIGGPFGDDDEAA